MSVTIDQFDEFFREVVRGEDGKTYDPFPWQTRLANQVFKDGWPECIDLPTASGKTSAIDIAVFVLACQAGLNTNDRKVGRRIFFTVNRRVIVDEAFDRSFKLAEKLLNADSGILKQVADALREISGDKKAPPLDVTQLRGGIYRDRAWARSITQPIVVCTTADQLGSRLLFRGYGVSSSMQPIHAALTACDSLILLDEAHVTRAFSQTLGLLNRYRNLDKTSPPMRFVQMTATPAGDISEEKRFSLKDENWNDPRNQKLKDRQQAHKVAELISTGKKSIVDEIVRRASEAAKGSTQAVGIIVNRVQTARDIHAKLVERFGAEVHLVIGRMRPIDRDKLQDDLKTIVGPARPDTLPKPCFVVATQCLEVGADYDFDALITECASIDALRQRFGRLNRKGRKIDVVAAIITNEPSLKDEDPIYGNALGLTWKWLRANDRKSIDFGIIEFKKFWDELAKSEQEQMLSPSRNAAVLLPAHLDAFCQTAPYPEPSPDVSFFIHGPQRDNAEVNVCWRADLGEDEKQWPDIVALLPPTSPECMTVPLHAVINWMRGMPTKNDADAPIKLETDESRELGKHCIVIWRGVKESFESRNPRDLRPGDTIVIPATDLDSLVLGHIPRDASGTLALDVAECAYEKIRRQRIVRVHPAIHPELKELLAYVESDDSFLSKTEIRRLLGSYAGDFTAGPEEIDYPPTANRSACGVIFRFNQLLSNEKELKLPIEDDGDNSSLESTHQVTLDAHTQHVVDRVKDSVDRLNLAKCSSLFIQSADLHDLGKSDIRFQAMLAGLTPYEAMDRPTLLAKSGQRGLTKIERDHQRLRAELPAGFRHEMLSTEIIASGLIPLDATLDRDLLLHLIAAHHGHARPFAPVVVDDADDETRSIAVRDISIDSISRRSWIPSHRLDSEVAERFWKLTRDHGWWGLAWLESVLRLADQQASAAEQEYTNDR